MRGNGRKKKRIQNQKNIKRITVFFRHENPVMLKTFRHAFEFKIATWMQMRQRWHVLNISLLKINWFSNEGHFTRTTQLSLAHFIFNLNFFRPNAPIDNVDRLSLDTPKWSMKLLFALVTILCENTYLSIGKSYSGRNYNNCNLKILILDLGRLNNYIT